MKYIKFIAILAIPAILGIYYGVTSKNSPKILTGSSGSNYIGQAVEEEVGQQAINNSYEDFSDLESFIKKIPGTYSLYIKDLNTNIVNEYNSDHFYDAASVFKIFVAVSVMKNVEQKNLNLDYFYKITPDDFETGTGILQYEDVGETYRVSDLLSLALKKSDNVAQNMLIRAINKNYIADSTFTLDNESSARKIGVFLENFYENKYISQDSRDYLLELMKATDFDDRINLGLSPDVEFAHKIGNWPTSSSWHDCGIILTDKDAIVVCLMSERTTYDDFVNVAKSVGQFAEGLIK